MIEKSGMHHSRGCGASCLWGKQLFRRAGEERIDKGKAQCYNEMTVIYSKRKGKLYAEYILW